MNNSLVNRLSLAARIILGKGLPVNKSRMVPAISQEDVVEVRNFFPLDKFFIFGHARSGTTMLTRLIRLHPQVHCNYQAHFFTRPPLLQSLVSSEEVGAWLTRPSNRWNRGADLSPVILRITADYILEREARRLGKLIVGDKSPSSLLDGEAVHLMHKVYPDGRLIYIVRDGRDTALSHRFQTFIEFPEQLPKEDFKIRQEFANDPTPFLKGEKSIFSERSLLRAAQGWVRNVQETHAAAQELYGKLYFSLTYEVLLSNTLEKMLAIWEFLGADIEVPGLRELIKTEMQENPDAAWQQEKAREIAEPIQKGKQGNWRELFTQHDKQIFHQVAGNTLEDWNYPPTLE